MTPRIRLASVAAALAFVLATVALAQNLGTAETEPVAVAGGTQSQLHPIGIGQKIDQRQLHRISRPGLYGISQPPNGSNYGIWDGKLVRYDPESLELQSVIRQVDRILD